MTKPTPSLNKSYVMLVERESQRTMTSSSINGTELVALIARKGDNYQYNRGQNHQYQKSKRKWEQ